MPLTRSNVMERYRIENGSFLRFRSDNMVWPYPSRFLKCFTSSFHDTLPGYIRHPLIPTAHTRAYSQNFHRVFLMRQTTCDNFFHQTLRQNPRSVAEGFREQYQKLLAPTTIQPIRGANPFPEVRANNLQRGVGRGASITFVEAAKMIHAEQGYRIGAVVARRDCIHVAEVIFHGAEIADLEQWFLT